jgi:hypothetical protein
MKHLLSSKECSSEYVNYSIYVIEIDSETVNIGIERTDFLKDFLCNEECINLNKKELHSLIGTLLHVQAKMKGGSNG